MDINEDVAVAGAFDGGEKSVKTEASARKIPLHPQLIAEGFMLFVHSRPLGAPLFADLVADRFGSRGGTASKRLGRFIRVKLGIVDKRIAPCHSFRHRFKEMCRTAKIHKEVHDAITGQREGDVSELYGDGFPAHELAEEIAKIKWIDLTTSVTKTSGGERG